MADLEVTTDVMDAVIAIHTNDKKLRLRDITWEPFPEGSPEQEAKLTSKLTLSLAGLIGLAGRREANFYKGHHTIIDGGHTPAAARYLLPDILYAKSVRFIVGMFRDKNAAAYLSTFDLPQFHFVYTQAAGERALTPNELLARYTPTQTSVTLVASPDEAFAQIESAPEQLIVVAGSFRMAAAAREAFGLLTPEDLDEARLTRAIFEGDAYQRKLT